MNEWINAWPSAVPPLPSVPVPCILSKCFKPDWEVKGTEEEWGEPQMQLAASPLPGGHSSLAFLPKAQRSLSVEMKGLWASISSPCSLWLSPMSHGKAKATQGRWGRSGTAEGEDRGHLSYLVSPHRGSHTLEGAASNSLVSLQKQCLIFCSGKLSGGLNLRAAVYLLGWWCSAPGCWLSLWVLGELSTYSDTYHPWGLIPSSFWGVSASVAPSLFAHLGLFHLD